MKSGLFELLLFCSLVQCFNALEELKVEPAILRMKKSKLEIPVQCSAICFISEKLTQTEKGVFANATIESGEILGIFPEHCVISTDYARKTCLNFVCGIASNCCVPLLLLDRNVDVDSCIYDRKHEESLGRHEFWKRKRSWLHNISMCKDHTDLGFLPRVSVDVFVKYLFFAESRGFFYDGGEGLVVLPLFSDMSYKQMFDEGKVGFDSSDKLFSKRKRFGLATKDDLDVPIRWVQKRQGEFTVVAPKRFSKNEELFRHLDGEFGSTELFFKYGVLPEHPTPFDRIYLNDESFISFLFSNVAVERKDVLMLLEKRKERTEDPNLREIYKRERMLIESFLMSESAREKLHQSTEI